MAACTRPVPTLATQNPNIEGGRWAENSYQLSRYWYVMAARSTTYQIGLTPKTSCTIETGLDGGRGGRE